LFDFEKGLDLFFSNKGKFNKSFTVFYIYTILENNDLKFADNVLSTIEKKIKNYEKEDFDTFFESLKNYKILVTFLETDNKNLLDRQPYEIRQTLKEMVYHLKPQEQFQFIYKIPEFEKDSILSLKEWRKQPKKYNKKKPRQKYKKR
jgi:hypothetical protein